LRSNDFDNDEELREALKSGVAREMDVNVDEDDGETELVNSVERAFGEGTSPEEIESAEEDMEEEEEEVEDLVIEASLLFVGDGET